MKKSLAQLVKAEVVTLEKSKMLRILGGAGEGDSTTKEWKTLVDGHPSTTDKSPDPDASVS